MSCPIIPSSITLWFPLQNPSRSQITSPLQCDCVFVCVFLCIDTAAFTGCPLTFSQVIHCYIEPGRRGLASLFCKRDLVMKRSWRVEEDGTYVVTIRSVEHPLCPPTETKSNLAWLMGPVRAKVPLPSFLLPSSLPLCPPLLPSNHSPSLPLSSSSLVPIPFPRAVLPPPPPIFPFH